MIQRIPGILASTLAYVYQSQSQWLFVASVNKFLGRTNLHTLPRSTADPLVGGKSEPETSVELSGKRELCSFRRNAAASRGWRCPGSTNLEQLLAQPISVHPVASCQLPEIVSWRRMENGQTKCHVCRAVNEQFHGNIVTLLLTAIGAEFLSQQRAAAPL